MIRVNTRDADNLARFFSREGDPLLAALGSNASNVIVNGFVCTRHGRPEFICNPPDRETADERNLLWVECRREYSRYLSDIKRIDGAPDEPRPLRRLKMSETGTAKSHAAREKIKETLANCTGAQQRMLRAALVPDPEQSLPDAFALTAASPTAVSVPPRKGRERGRNQPCDCGSGKKRKKCCGKEREEAAEKPKGHEFRGAFLESPAVRESFQRWIGLEAVSGTAGTVGKYSRELRRWLKALAELATATNGIMIALAEETTRLTQAEAEEELLRLVGEVETELACAFRAAGIEAEIIVGRQGISIMDLAKALHCDSRTLRNELKDRDIEPIRDGKRLVIPRRMLLLRYPKAARAIAC